MHITRRLSLFGLAGLALGFVALGASDASAGGLLEPPFSDDYTLTDLGTVPGLPGDYGGVTLFAGTQNLLMGGFAAEPEGEAYLVPVLRDAGGHIIGFNGSAIQFTETPEIDGGLTFGPENVLFYSRYNPPAAEIGQFAIAEPANLHKVVDLAPLGVSRSPGGLNFVPPGFPGAGQLKLTSYSDGDWYSLEIAPDGMGTFNVTSATMRADLPDGKEGFAFVPLGSPVFGANPQVLINEYNAGSISAFELDANGDPTPGSRQPFITGLDGPDGAFIDPLTGDLLITEFDGHRVFRVDGFAPAVRKGDNNCDGLVNAVDALAALRTVAGLFGSQRPGCPGLGESLGVNLAPQGNGVPVYGDIDCDHDLDAVDALVILRFVAALPVNLPQGCPPLGAG